MASLQINKTEWDLSSLKKGKTFEEKRKLWKNATKNFILKWKNMEDYLENPSALKEALDDFEEWNHYYGSCGDELYYFWLKTQQEQNNSKLKAQFNNVEEFSKEIGNSMQFFTLKVGKIKKEKQNEFLNYSDLKKYKHFLERLFNEAEYMLSEKEEKIMNLKSTSSYSNWVKMVSGFLSKEEREVLDEKGKKAVKSFSDFFLSNSIFTQKYP